MKMLPPLIYSYLFIPNVAKEEYNEISVRSMNIDDRPTTDLTLWKISNSHNSATRHPIHFMYVRPLYFALGHRTSLSTL